MAHKEQIRINKITKEWEHFVPATASLSGYWAPGISGNNNINMINIIPDITYYNNFNEVIVYEGVYTPYTVLLNREFPDPKLDKISELIDIEKYKPSTTITLQEYLQTDEINLLIKSKINFQLQVFNPQTNTNNAGLQFKWNIGKKTLQTGNPILTIAFNSIEQSGELYYTAINEYNQFESDKVRVKIYDPLTDGLIRKNIIPNGDFKDGLSGWSVELGSPYILPFYDEVSKYGLFDPYLYPAPNSLLFPDYKPDLGFYVCGGKIDNSYISILSKEISVEKISDIIDKKIIGVNEVTGTFYAYVGSWGNAALTYYGLYPNKEITLKSDGRPLNTNIYVKDEVRVEISCLAESNEVITNTTYELKNLIHEALPIFILKFVSFNIPAGTRFIKIRIIFEKNSETAQYFNYRFWEHIAPYTNESYLNAFTIEHLTAVTGLNFRIDINNSYLYNEKLILNNLLDQSYIDNITTGVETGTIGIDGRDTGTNLDASGDHGRAPAIINTIYSTIESRIQHIIFSDEWNNWFNYEKQRLLDLMNYYNSVAAGYNLESEFINLFKESILNLATTLFLPKLDSPSVVYWTPEQEQKIKP